MHAALAQWTEIEFFQTNDRLSQWNGCPVTQGKHTPFPVDVKITFTRALRLIGTLNGVEALQLPAVMRIGLWSTIRVLTRNR